MIRKLWSHLTKRRHKQLILLVILMIFASLAEVISIGSVIPFLGMLSSPEAVFNHHLIQPFNKIFGISSANQLLFPMTIAFIVAVFLAGLIRLALLYSTIKLTNSIGTDISTKIYHITLHQEYEVHASQNSGEIINSVITKTNETIKGIIFPSLNIISSTITILAIIVALIIIDSFLAFATLISFGSIYSAVIYLTKKHLLKNSRTIADKSSMMIKSLQEGLGGIRDILLDNNQKFYSDIYKKSDFSYRKAVGSNQFIGGSPRFIIETLSIGLIALAAFYMTESKNNFIAAIPILGALALGGQKLIPAFQQTYASFSKLRGSYASFYDVLKLLNQPLLEKKVETKNTDSESYKPLVFNNEISVDNLSFFYKNTDNKNSKLVLEEINLKIMKGSKVGIIGETGSGKSTLIDIIMGLLSPTIGSISVDDKIITRDNRHFWQHAIAHVPQDIYISDGTIEENIAFGVPKKDIDFDHVKKSARKAQIHEFIENKKEGYKTIVGERGVRLSGGQLQRLGIARALYKRATVLVFDEATSALDSHTEGAVMKAINNLEDNLTILIIAHRLTTLQDCDEIYKISNKKIFKE
jgi:ATP-binding cassette, subfamily B, bacterial PglK